LIADFDAKGDVVVGFDIDHASRKLSKIETIALPRISAAG